MPDSLARVSRDVVACERCPRLRALVPRGRAREGEALPRPGVLGPARPRLRRPAGAAARGRPGPRRARRQPHRPRLHRRPLRRLPVRRRSTAPASRASRSRSARDDGLRCATATSPPVARCAPPANKPTPAEIARCREYLAREWALLARAARRAGAGPDRDGRLSRDAARDRPPAAAARPEFAHGAVHDLGGGVRLFCSYHVSQQNTFTGRLTPRSFDAVLAGVKRHLARAGDVT